MWRDERGGRMILASIISLSLGVIILTCSGIAATYADTRYEGIGSSFRSEREKFTEKDHLMNAVLKGLSYGGVAVGSIALMAGIVLIIIVGVRA